jgi:DNA-binding transcriptional regulator YdaS (Cro superfamily)
MTAMQVGQVVKFFGGKAATARALGLSRGAITNWGDDRATVPYSAVWRVERASKGALKHDPAKYQRIADQQARRRSLAAKLRHQREA